MKLTITLLLLVAASGCGPGVTDGEYSISHGYAFHDSGGNGKVITHREGDRKAEIIVSPRVDAYYLDDEKLIIARRPAEVMWRGQIADWKVSADCEYWMIDVGTHAIQQIPDASKWPGIRCN